MRISDWSSDVCSSDLTGIFTKYPQDHYRGLVGLRGAFNRFDWEISAWGSRDESGSSGSRSFDPNAVIAALASPESTPAINPFVNDGTLRISAEQLRRLFIPLYHRARHIGPPEGRERLI